MSNPKEVVEPQFLYYCPRCGAERHVFLHETTPLCCGSFMCPDKENS